MCISALMPTVRPIICEIMGSTKTIVDFSFIPDRPIFDKLISQRCLPNWCFPT